MQPPIPLMQQLRRLQEISAEMRNFRFMVDTPDGLRLLPLEEALKLIPKPVITFPPSEAQLTEKQMQDAEQMLAQLQEQVDLHQRQLQDLHDRVVTMLEQDPLPPLEMEFAPDESVAIGIGALEGGAKDRENVAIGIEAGLKLEGHGNTILGPHAAKLCDGELVDVTAVGSGALACASGDMRNVTALGSNTRHTGDNQVILGDHLANVYSINAMHRRADRRDMAEVGTCELGLDFVMNVTPIQYRLDARESYIDWTTKPVEPEALRPRPQLPEGDKDAPGYQEQLMAYHSDRISYEREEKLYNKAMSQYYLELSQWVENNKLVRIRATGEHAGERLHMGFDATQLLSVLENFGVNAAMVQDHSVNGGEGVLTAADAELVPVLWNAVREINTYVHSQTFVDQVASALLTRHAEMLAATQALPVAADLPEES